MLGRTLRTALLLYGVLILQAHPACAGEGRGGLEDSLAGVTVGTSIDDLLNQYPDLHRSTIPSVGTVQYEGCRRDSTELFTFVEQLSSKGFVAAIWIHHADPAILCSGGPGGLPQLTVLSMTPRGVRLGDERAQVVERYGKPDRQKILTDGKELLEYRSKAGGASANGVRLFFRLFRGAVVDITLSGGLSPASAKTK